MPGTLHIHMLNMHSYVKLNFKITLPSLNPMRVKFYSAFKYLLLAMHWQ